MYAYSQNNANLANPVQNLIQVREGARNLADAGYAHVEWHATDQLEIAGGIRYTSDRRRVMPDRVLVNSYPRGALYGAYQAGLINQVGCLFTTPINGVQRPAGGFVLFGANAVGSGACPDITLSKDYHYLSYEATARYRVGNFAIYARTGLGQKSGGINIPVVATDVPPYNPERVRDYEIGFKGERVLGGHVDFSLALYHSSYNELQRYLANVLPNGAGISNIIINAGSARVNGIEGDFTARVGGGFSVNGFFGYTDAKYRRFTAVGANGTIIDLSQQPFYLTPRFTSRLGALYETRLAGGHLTIGGGWNHQSNSSLSVIYFPGAETGDVNLFDGRIAWTTEDRHLEFAVYGTNLSNHQYFTDVGINRTGVSTDLSAVTGAYGVQNEPRFIGGSVTFRFGH